MSYPGRLLPQSSDKIIKEINTEHLLCRWVDPSLELRDSSGNLSAEVIEEKRLPGYSTNKLPPSEVDDIKIAFHNEEFEKQWTEGESVRIPQEHDFYITDRNFFLFRIADIFKFTNTYPYPPDSSARSYYFEVHVVHKPLRGNVSHFEFDIKYYNSGSQAAKGPSSKSATFKKIIAADIRKRLIKIAKFDTKEFNRPAVAIEKVKGKEILSYRIALAIFALLGLLSVLVFFIIKLIEGY